MHRASSLSCHFAHRSVMYVRISVKISRISSSSSCGGGGGVGGGSSSSSSSSSRRRRIR